jgi:hypothetical protein
MQQTLQLDEVGFTVGVNLAAATYNNDKELNRGGLP